MLASTPPQSLAIVEIQDARGVNSPMSTSKPKSKLSKSRKAVVTEATATLPIDPLPQSASGLATKDRLSGIEFAPDHRKRIGFGPVRTAVEQHARKLNSF
jgi:hypothetical protein